MVSANILAGVTWGLWHAPFILLGFNYGNLCILGIVMCGRLVPPGRLMCRSREYLGSVCAPAIIYRANEGGVRT